MSDDDIIELIEGPDDAPVGQEPGWVVVVIDDDEEVHAATRIALRRVEILGRPLTLVHLHSAAEARLRLAGIPAPAVILLDVVMETDDAGLQLVDFIRNQCQLVESRIILRTGQPGQAPELDVFERYDINDYRTKSELTRTRLITAISGAIRSYDQIRTIAENRRGLELIVRSAPDLLEQHALNRFAEGVLTQLAALLRVPVDGIVCAQRGSPVDQQDERLFVFGAVGCFGNCVMQPLDVLGADDTAALIAQAIDSRRHVIEARRSALYLHSSGRDGAVFIATGRPLHDVDRQLIEVFAANISACYSNLRRFEEINTIAFVDMLSGLGNRAQLLRDLEAPPALVGPPQVLALFDISRFAEVNDGLGHDVGNLLLAAVGQRLRIELGEHCRLARIGGDVFAVLGAESGVNPASLFALLAAPFEAGEHLLPLRGALGLCRLDGPPVAAIEWLKRANLALNRAKRSAVHFHAWFEPSMELATRERLAIIHSMHEDFARGRLQVWFQPQVSAVSGEVAAIEALLRWPDAAGGFVQPPNVFVPLAEHSGLIVELGYFVLEQSVAALAQLTARANAPGRVSVNVSLAQFRQADFLQRIEHIIAASGLPMQSVELEITESIAMDEPKVVGHTLGALRELGIRVAIDDFGTGFSSLNRLRDLPIDVIKIDQSFVREIDQGQGTMFVETIINLSLRLGVETVAEGVETDAQLACLQAIGCPIVQGYRFARPMPLAQLVDWLAQYRPVASA